MWLKRWSETLTNWERWPFTFIYAPLGPLWIWYAVKAKAFWWFSAANPSLTFSGFEGEGKREMYELLPERSFPKTIYVARLCALDEVNLAIIKSGMTYPVCAKPEVGLKGLLFRRIGNKEALKIYHQKVLVDYVIQEMIEAPVEVSVFYYRHPSADKGTISGFIQKDLLHVVGDGLSTLSALIRKHPKALYRQQELFVKHAKALQAIIPLHEKYILTHAANLNRGAQFTNLNHLIDDTMLLHFDALSHRCNWYYGRYDLKCNSVQELKKGNFVILEFNGAGAEPNHVYNTGCSWFAALKEFAHHWHMLYTIARYNNQHKGVRYWGNREGSIWLKVAGRHGRLLEKLDREVLI